MSFLWDTRLSVGARLLYALLRDRQDGPGPTQAALGIALRCSDRTLRGYLIELERAGVVRLAAGCIVERTAPDAVVTIPDHPSPVIH